MFLDVDLSSAGGDGLMRFRFLCVEVEIDKGRW